MGKVMHLDLFFLEGVIVIKDESALLKNALIAVCAQKGSFLRPREYRSTSRKKGRRLLFESYLSYRC